MAVLSGNTSLEDFEGSPTFISNTGRYGGGQGATVNGDITPQGNQSGGRRVDNATDKGIGVAVPLTNLGGLHVKGWVSIIQIALVTKLQLVVASGTGTGDVDYHTLPVAEYRQQVRAIPLWVDVDRTPEQGGSANAAAIVEMGARASIGDVGGNAQNFILDEISHGGSLTWEGAGGDLQDFRDYEATNDEGVLLEIIGTDFCFARLIIGTATATTFTESGFSLKFPDQSLVADDFMGVTIDLQNAGTTVDLSDGSIESENVAAAGKRPDFIVSGTAGALTLNTVSLSGLRAITLTSAATVTNGTLGGLAMTQGGATISGATLRPNTASGVPWCSDPDFVALSNVVAVQDGSGHLFEIDTAGTYAIDVRDYSGFGANGTNDAAIYVSAPSGTVTINVPAGAATPTYRTAGATVVINNSVAVNFEDIVSGSHLQIEATATVGSVTAGDILESVVVTADPHVYNHNFEGNLTFRYHIRNAPNAGPWYQPFDGIGTITANGFTQIVSQQQEAA